MCMDKRLLYIPAFADIQKIHAVLDTTIKQLMQEAGQVTTQEIIGEIIDNGNIDEVYRSLTDIILSDKRKYQTRSKEYRACLIAIRKINKWKNEAIDALSDV